ncbi:hypothetical protein C8R47DRAFT_1203012 [Mycena vitilis]|nr:hypothetical protein C8R47DRAFT_1203012 [Mycena vitilis]
MFPNPETYSLRLNPAVQHPMLRLDNLDNPPLELQRTGNLLLIRNSDKMRGCILSSKSTLEVERVRSLLPVWYANFDTAGIPPPTQLTRRKRSVRLSPRLLELNLTCECSQASAIYLKKSDIRLWARVWPWIEFHLHGLPGRTALYTTLLKSVLHFQNHKCRDLVGSTPVRPIRRHNIFDIPFHEVRYCPGRVAEYSEGLSGDIDHMATLILQLLALAFVDDKTPTPRRGSQRVKAVLGFLLRINHSERYRDPLVAAPVRGGIIPALVTATCSLALAGSDDDPEAAGIVLEVIERVVHILAYLPSLLCDVEDLVKAEAFVASPVYPSWRRADKYVPHPICAAVRRVWTCTIYTQQISQWSQDPTAQWYLLFDYMHGPVRVALRPWPQDTAAESVNKLPPDWVTRRDGTTTTVSAQAKRAACWRYMCEPGDSGRFEGGCQKAMAFWLWYQGQSQAKTLAWHGFWPGSDVF